MRCQYNGCAEEVLGESTSCLQHRIAMIVQDEEDEGSPILPPTMPFGMLHGPVGEYVNAVAEYTEAHRAAIYVAALACLGAMINRGPYVSYGQRQRANLFVCTIGVSGMGRKSAGAGIAYDLIRELDPEFARLKIKGGGISSGEGVLEEVRDPEYDTNNKLIRGTPDQRVVFFQDELANLLKQGQRGGNTASDIIRQAWDPRPMHLTRRQDPAVSSNHHISIVGNITGTELFNTASVVDYEGGLLPRFLFVYATPEHEIPWPKEPGEEIFRLVVPRLRNALVAARKVTGMTVSPEANDYWGPGGGVYHELNQPAAAGRPGDLLSRRTTHPIRVAFLLALLDGSSVLELEHLVAGLALQEYVEDSVVYSWNMWGGSGTIAGGIEAATKYAVAGATTKILGTYGPDAYVTVTKLRRLFSNNKSRGEIAQLMNALVTQGYFRPFEQKKTGGRPSVGWLRVR